MSIPKTSRRKFLGAALGAAAMAAAPSSLRAQTKSFKLGIVHPVTGTLTEPGQACRLGAKMATEAINVAGGFLVTQRMLEMFRKKQPKGEKGEA